MLLTEYMLFTVIAVAQVGSPKTSTIFLVNHTLVHSPKREILILSGDVLATAILAICSLLGVSSLLWAYPNILKIMQFSGAGYVLWLSVKHLQKTNDNRENSVQHVIYGRPPVLWVRSFISGISNPTTVLFFFSLLPQFIVSAQEIDTEALSLLVIIFALTKLLLPITHTLTAKKMTGWIDDSRAVLWSKRVCAAVMMIFGIAMGIRAAD